MSVSRYDKALLHLAKGDVDFDTADVRVGLLTADYVPNYAVDEYWADVNPDEVSGTGYTANGAALTGEGLTQTSGVVYLDAADKTFTAPDFSVQFIVLFCWSGSAATSILLGAIDLEDPVVLTGSNWTIEWDALGILSLG